jgi:hypothetical protein
MDEPDGVRGRLREEAYGNRIGFNEELHWNWMATFGQDGTLTEQEH